MIRLVDVYSRRGSAKILYELLAERTPSVNISHKKMPSWRQHTAFVRSRPYKSWFLICEAGKVKGSIYLSKNNEIGIFLFKRHRGKRIGRTAVMHLIRHYPGSRRFLANINPRNRRSIDFFESLGFRHIQNTYEKLSKRRQKRGAAQ